MGRSEARRNQRRLTSNGLIGKSCQSLSLIGTNNLMKSGEICLKAL
jgi:hypothetical protein